MVFNIKNIKYPCFILKTPHPENFKSVIEFSKIKLYLKGTNRKYVQFHCSFRGVQSSTFPLHLIVHPLNAFLSFNRKRKGEFYSLHNVETREKNGQIGNETLSGKTSRINLKL